MKKFAFLFYLIIATGIAIAISCSVFYLVSLVEIDLYSRLFIHTNAQKIRFLQEDDGHSALRQLYSEGVPFTSFVEDSVAPYRIGILFSGAQDAVDTISSTITEGRFFLSEDFFAGHRYAVVGTGLSAQIYSASGYQWIAIDGVPFQVIGILDTGTNAPVDQCIYYNLDALPIPDLCYVDGNNTRQIAQSLSILEHNTSLQTLDAPKSGVSRLINLASAEKFFFFLAICSIFVFHFYSIRLLAFACGDLACVRCLLGHSFRRVSFYVMVCIFGILSIISILVCGLGDALIVPRFHFGHISFPRVPSLLTLMLSFALPSAVYGKFYFLNIMKRRLGCL